MTYKELLPILEHVNTLNRSDKTSLLNDLRDEYIRDSGKTISPISTCNSCQRDFINMIKKYYYDTAFLED